uniref:Uncharacterized protein n=1 Tax=Ascaris lumbricoides TaxID=6252 RepID=A0A0M3IQR1_ASCLU
MPILKVAHGPGKLYLLAFSASLVKQHMSGRNRKMLSERRSLTSSCF